MLVPLRKPTLARIARLAPRLDYPRDARESRFFAGYRWGFRCAGPRGMAGTSAQIRRRCRRGVCGITSPLGSRDRIGRVSPEWLDGGRTSIVGLDLHFGAPAGTFPFHRRRKRRSSRDQFRSLQKACIHRRKDSRRASPRPHLKVSRYPMSVSALPDHLGSLLRGFQHGTERWNPGLDSMRAPSNKPSRHFRSDAFVCRPGSRLACTPLRSGPCFDCFSATSMDLSATVQENAGTS